MSLELRMEWLYTDYSGMLCEEKRIIIKMITCERMAYMKAGMDYFRRINRATIFLPKKDSLKEFRASPLGAFLLFGIIKERRKCDEKECFYGKIML